MTPEELFSDGEIDARKLNSGSADPEDVTAQECRQIREEIRGGRISREYRQTSEWAHSTLRKHLRGECSHDVEPLIYSRTEGWVAESDADFRDPEFLRRRREQGHTMLDIAAECDVTAATIQYWLEQHDIG